MYLFREICQAALDRISDAAAIYSSPRVAKNQTTYSSLEVAAWRMYRNIDVMQKYCAMDSDNSINRKRVFL